METLPRRGVSREEMMRRVARFADLKGFDGGLPDSRMPGSIRTLYNVIDFQPPAGAKGAVTSPVGDDSSRLAAIKISGCTRETADYASLSRKTRKYRDESTAGFSVFPAPRIPGAPRLEG